MYLKSKKVLMILAHCDDEIICGWPVFQNKTINKKIIICSSDEYNKRRKSCKYRKHAYYEICQKYNIQGICLDYDSDFYKLESRYGSLTKFKDRIIELMSEHSDVDCIFCHNPMGEYGHLDHKLIFDIVINYAKKPIIISDINMQTNWPSQKNIPEKIFKAYYSNKFMDCKLDINDYEKVENIYRDHKVWTWCLPAVEKCSLYLID